MVSTAVQIPLMTADEFARLPQNGQRVELVRGHVVEKPMPLPDHGYFCNNVSYYLTAFIKQRDLGRVMSNDSWIVTERDPDSVRGADCCYFSFERVPRGPMPKGLIPEPPELVVEVRSPSDRWVKVVSKVAEYLEAGVLVVCVVNPKKQQVSIFRREGEDETVLKIDDELTLPDILPGFSVQVGKLFE